MTAQFRWAAGTKTKAEIQADTTAPIASWPWKGERWVADISPVIDRFIVEEISLANTIGEFGRINFTVAILVANGEMRDYIEDTYFAGGVREAAQTLQVYDLPNYSDEWIVVNCTGRSPGRKASILTPKNHLMPYLTYTFFGGVIAATGA